jgi:hypothetical protein
MNTPLMVTLNASPSVSSGEERLWKSPLEREKVERKRKAGFIQPRDVSEKANRLIALTLRNSQHATH